MTQRNKTREELYRLLQNRKRHISKSFLDKKEQRYPFMKLALEATNHKTIKTHVKIPNVYVTMSRAHHNLTIL